jgi:hypothetical protein
MQHPHHNRSATWKTLFFVALFALSTCATAQKSIKNETTTTSEHCPAVNEVSAQHLYGLWRVDFYDIAPPADLNQLPRAAPVSKATIVFERHPEHAGSLHGTLSPVQSSTTPAPISLLSGDLEDGELILDESDDGQRISAVWVGEVLPTGCGKDIRGTRRLSGEDTGPLFILKKMPGWR